MPISASIYITDQSNPEGTPLPTFPHIRRFGRAAALLLGLSLFACAPTALPDVPSCGAPDSPICNHAPAEADAGGCTLYFIEGGRLHWQALHDPAGGTLLDDPARPVIAVAAEENELFFLYTDTAIPKLGRIDRRGRTSYDICPLPDGAARLCLSAGELFCTTADNACFRLTDLRRADPIPVGTAWALTADAFIFADGPNLRACLRDDLSTITALAALPGGAAITAIAIDQATEEETRIYILAEDGQVASFADGSWSFHGAPWPEADPAAFTAAADGCLVTTPDGVWYINIHGGAARVCAPLPFAVAEDGISPAPYREYIPLPPTA